MDSGVISAAWSSIGNKGRSSMKNERGVVVLAVVALCLLFSGIAFMVGHRIPVQLDSPDMVK
jgi:hypothetical protein